MMGRKFKEWKDTSLVWCTVSHAQMGGITLGRFRIAMPKAASYSNVTRGSMVRRTLKHVLDHTLRGFPQGEAEEYNKKRKLGEERQCDGESRVLPGMRQVVVSTHCVTQKSIQIKRYLSLKEILDVYDVQLELQSAIENLERQEQSQILDKIVKAVPEKVVYPLVKEVIQSCLEKAEGEVDEPMKWLREMQEDPNKEQAVKNDNAAIETEQWDRFTLRTYDSVYQVNQLKRMENFRREWKREKNLEPKICKGLDLTQSHCRIFDWLRERMLMHYRRSVTLSFISYLRDNYDELLRCKPRDGRADIRWLVENLQEENKKTSRKRQDWLDRLKTDLEQGIQAITLVSRASYWDWDGGSCLLFWRWPDEFVEEARNGTKPFITGKLPRFRSGQRWPKDRATREAMEEKWIKIISRGYVGTGPVISLTGSFPVPKGDDDIRMVYDATRCGLNEVLWAPNFFLPTIDTTLRHVDSSSWFGDIDFGEQFLNFSLHPSLRQYAGIDVTGIKDLLKGIDQVPASLWKGKGRAFLRWERCLMGLRSSPFNAVRATSWAEDIIRGDPLDINNIFRWDRYILNLPGMVTYNPSMPRGYKWDDNYQGLASNFETYVDDIRSSGRSEVLCARTSRRIASIFNFLGIQDAARKRRFPSQAPGVWCGARTVAENDGLYTGTTQIKWDRGKSIISEWLKEFLEKGELNRKDMLKGRGFLVHLSRTYPGMNPFFKRNTSYHRKLERGTRYRWVEIF